MLITLGTLQGPILSGPPRSGIAGDLLVTRGPVLNSHPEPGWDWEGGHISNMGYSWQGGNHGDGAEMGPEVWMG